MSIAVGEKREIYKGDTDERFCIDVTAENVDMINQYDKNLSEEELLKTIELYILSIS